MTIKKQFHILLVAIIIIPFLCASFIPVYHYFTSPERELIHDYRKLRKSKTLTLSPKEWDQLYTYLRLRPPDMEMSVIAINNNATILISSMPELKVGKTVSPTEIWNFAATTSEEFFYQITSFSLDSSKTKIIILSRIHKYRRHNTRGMNIIYFFVAFLLLFAIILIMVIIKISRNIFTSITILEKRTQKIADGNLRIPLIDNSKQTKIGSNEIISLTESLDKMRLALLDAQERRTRFIMGISHDLRTPVAVIKGYTEAISDNVVNNPSEIKKSLEIIMTKTNQLESMIDSLINFIKINSADWRQKLITESLYEVINQFVENAKMTCNVFKRKITTEINISKEINVPMDKQLFLRALENLLSNAIRYSKDGDEITISGTENNSNCIISVQDTGIGIDEKDCKCIFDMFFRATNSRREEGIGIGLTVVKSIIETHGWTIDVKSKLGDGTTFFITIPKTKQ